MVIFAQVTTGIYLQDASTLNIPIGIHFNNGGTIENTSATLQITPPNTVSDITLNLRIRTAVSDYVDSNYSTSTSQTDVLLVSGGVTLPLL